MAAISREGADKAFLRLNELRDQAGEAVIEQAHRSNRVFSYADIANIIHQGYVDFASKVHQEYRTTPYEDLAEVFILASKTHFYYTLNRKVGVSEKAS